MDGPTAYTKAKKHLANAETLTRRHEHERASVYAQIGTGYALLANAAATCDQTADLVQEGRIDNIHTGLPALSPDQTDVAEG
ncbi:hypothetical protein ACWFMI_23925 [Nocardiopsis terrae]|uniref:hypothetical protein n=1 Tax=Streptomyces sp. NPDC057554 TaxID=3350538 RepID=UPI0036BCC8CE